MNQDKVLKYAKKHIEVTAKENGISSVNIEGDNLYIEMNSGKTYELSQKEIKYQAGEFLNSEIEYLKHG